MKNHFEEKNILNSDTESTFNITNKCFYVTGIVNSKSIAFHVAKLLKKHGAKVILSVQNSSIQEKVAKLFPTDPIFILDVEDESEVKKLSQSILKFTDELHGFFHSMAFAKLQENLAFHEYDRSTFWQATQISAFSLIEMCQHLKSVFHPKASVVSMSISNTSITTYGLLGPIKGLLENIIPYLAKSFSAFSQIRFNAIGAGPLKTSASSGIPNFVENYLYNEHLTLRKENLHTLEVAQTALFLLSPLSSGINASTIKIDAGVNANLFDEQVIKKWNDI